MSLYILTCHVCFHQGPKLEDFTNKIQDAIAKLGGSVFPKLNWSAPKVSSVVEAFLVLCCSCYFKPPQ